MHCKQHKFNVQITVQGYENYSSVLSIINTVLYCYINSALL